ncbi:epoxide hydrolase N-terminal domain-containing protein [Variovorax sp. RB3P1]|uniref:epoxide hydrolase N-terminal domain-containing protein n=1 Tax=Variovorax sp. RB3P1 TaxID=3443732 RepID=UPI003F48658D
MRRSRGCKTFAYPWQRRTIGGQARNRLTRFAQHRIVINGIAVHSIHFRARHSEALPLLLTYGWPGSIDLGGNRTAGGPNWPWRQRNDAFRADFPSLNDF